jgi:hypothetical protein
MTRVIILGGADLATQAHTPVRLRDGVTMGQNRRLVAVSGIVVRFTNG